MNVRLFSAATVTTISLQTAAVVVFFVVLTINGVA